MISDEKTGQKIYELAQRLFPIHRHLIGKEVIETLEIINEYIVDSGYKADIINIPSGTEVFDWTIPKEWVLREAYIEDENGNRVIDVKENNLYVLQYSTPINRWMERDELLDIIHVQEDQPESIPYVTSYYERNCGFCMEKSRRERLEKGKYHAVIDSEFADGQLTYGEVFIKGKLEQEVFFSTYICHPSMANDNCSGMALQSELINYVASLRERKYSYRFVFVPETIGAIAYISKNLENLKRNVIAGFNLSCVGDDGCYSIIHTRSEDTLTDKLCSHLCSFKKENSIEYSYYHRGSDERQYNSPLVNLPIVTFTRSIFHVFREYHTSLDNMSFVSPQGFKNSYAFLRNAINILEANECYSSMVYCEPQLGKRGLYPNVSRKDDMTHKESIFQVAGYVDGKHDLIDIGNKIGVPANELIEAVEVLKEAGCIGIRKSQ